MSEQLKKFKLKWVKYEGWNWVGDDPCDEYANEFEFVRAQDADALAERLRECEAERLRFERALVQIQHILKSRHLSDAEMNLAALSETTWTLTGGNKPAP